MRKGVIAMQQQRLHGYRLQAYLDEQAQSAPTEQIRAVRPVNTGPLRAIVDQPPAHVVIHIGSILPSLADLTPVTQSIILTGFKMAYINRRVPLHDVTYLIVDVF